MFSYSSSYDFAVCSMHHTKLQSTTGKLVCVRNMILNNSFISYLEDIKRHKQQLIVKKNQNKNKSHKIHIYKVCEKVIGRNKKIEPIRVAVQRYLSNNQGMDTCNCYHASGCHARAHKYYMD